MGIFSSFFGNLFDDRPAVNIDGTPMSGDFDINGNPFGVTEADHGANDAFSSDTTSLDMGNDASLFDASSSSAFDDTSSSSISTSSDDSFSPSFEVDDAFSSDFSTSDDAFSSSWDD